MKLKPTLTSLAIAAAAFLPSLAQSALLDFEGTTSFASIAEFYNGGTDGGGLSGTNYGVSFTAPALGLSNDATTTFFSNAPSPGSVMFASPDAPAFLNVAAGFTGLVSFWYSASQVNVGDAVGVYSGLNGSGALLASFLLGANGTGGCTDSPFCHFDQQVVNLGGIAHSINFSAAAGNVAFDNISLSPVPEPEGLALMLAGLGLVGASARRRSRA